MSQIEKEFLAEECGAEESHVYNSFAQEYLGIFDHDINKTVCGQCIFFTTHCTTSKIEAKFGDARTPSCSEFILKEIK